MTYRHTFSDPSGYRLPEESGKWVFEPDVDGYPSIRVYDVHSFQFGGPAITPPKREIYIALQVGEGTLCFYEPHAKLCYRRPGAPR